MKDLKDVTVVIIDCQNQGRAIAAIQKTLKEITPAKTLFFTDIHINVQDVETIVIPKITSKNQYSHFLIKELGKYIETDYCLVIQHDGYVLNGDLWDENWVDEFSGFDYIGARWLFPDTERSVGNGGFSIRSKKLLDVCAKDDFIKIAEQEDDLLCRLYGAYLEDNYGIEFADIHTADKFSFELREPTQKTFGFHGYFHQPFIDHVVIKRTGAMGDLIMAEPILTYYYEKGYQIVLDTLPEMMPIFFNHPYKIKHISEINPNIKPFKVINLDMSYESKPKQNVLKTYYEFAGITDGEMRNSRLHVNQQPQQRLFNKFIVFHISDTGMTHRNCYGVNWQFVDSYYQRLGYTCIQVSGGEPVGIWFNAETKPMLMFLLRGADAVCAIDSGIAQLSVALGVPTAIFFGSINPKLRYQDFSKIEPIRTGCPNKELEYCYHNVDSSTVGNKCVIDEGQPPCCVFNEYQVIDALNKLLKLK